MKTLTLGAISALALTGISACATSPEYAECTDQSFSIFFDTDQSDLSDSNAETISKIANASDACPAYDVRLAGYADSVGASEYNTDLSESRARSVLDGLRAGGIDTDRVTIIPVGERAAVTDDNADAYLRRVTVEMTPLD